MLTQALEGVGVLDLTHYIAGPYCTKLLADFGAEVIKIERPVVGDPARRLGPFFHDIPHLEGSALFLHLNTNKRSLTLNLKSADGKAILRRLVPTVQIIVENFRPGVLDDLGIGYEALQTLNPSVVLTSVSNFGQNGPYRDLKASEIVESAMGGPMNVTGHPEREPLKLGGSVVQYHAGAIAAYATTVALWKAETEGSGDWVDISIYETQAANRDRRVGNLVAHAYTGEVGMRQGGRPRPLAGVRPTADGYVNLVGSGARLASTLRMIGREDLLGEERMRDPTSPGHATALEQVEALYLEWLRDQPKDDVVARAQAARVLAAPVNTLGDLFVNRHFQARDPWNRIDHPHTGVLLSTGRPFVMSETPQGTVRPAPLLGEHTARILCDQLGYPREDLRRLAEQGVI